MNLGSGWKMVTPILAAHRELGEQEECARVVAWLRSEGWDNADYAADCIERSEHHKEGE